MTRARARLGAVLALAGLAGSLLACAAVRPIVAENGDLADYRAFRVAAHPGTRLARAQAYLEAHPGGAWAAEVRAAFEDEEPAYFEAAKVSREKARDYLVDLPRGPHESAAIALLLELDAKVDDIETARLLREARKTEAVLDRASAQRRAVGERILGFLVALMDPEVYGVPFDAAPAPLLRALDGPARRTWGRTPARRTEDLFFSLPTKRERESRIALVTFEVVTDGPPESRVREGRISGPELFLRWLEADEMRALDGAEPGVKGAARAHAAEVLGGALEARMPAGRCAGEASGARVLVRACDGFTVTATAGERAGEPDAIVVRGGKP